MRGTKGFPIVCKICQLDDKLTCRFIRTCSARDLRTTFPEHAVGGTTVGGALPFSLPRQCGDCCSTEVLLIINPTSDLLFVLFVQLQDNALCSRVQPESSLTNTAHCHGAVPLHNSSCLRSAHVRVNTRHNVHECAIKAMTASALNSEQRGLHTCTAEELCRCVENMRTSALLVAMAVLVRGHRTPLDLADEVQSIVTSASERDNVS